MDSLIYICKRLLSSWGFVYKWLGNRWIDLFINSWYARKSTSSSETVLQRHHELLQKLKSVVTTIPNPVIDNRSLFNCFMVSIYFIISLKMFSGNLSVINFIIYTIRLSNWGKSSHKWSRGFELGGKANGFLFRSMLFPRFTMVCSMGGSQDLFYASTLLAYKLVFSFPLDAGWDTLIPYDTFIPTPWPLFLFSSTHGEWRRKKTRSEEFSLNHLKDARHQVSKIEKGFEMGNLRIWLTLNDHCDASNDQGCLRIFFSHNPFLFLYLYEITLQYLVSYHDEKIKRLWYEIPGEIPV